MGIIWAQMVRLTKKFGNSWVIALITICIYNNRSVWDVLIQMCVSLTHSTDSSGSELTQNQTLFTLGQHQQQLIRLDTLLTATHTHTVMKTHSGGMWRPVQILHQLLKKYLTGNKSHKQAQTWCWNALASSASDYNTGTNKQEPVTEFMSPGPSSVSLTERKNSFSTETGKVQLFLQITHQL